MPLSFPVSLFNLLASFATQVVINEWEGVSQSHSRVPQISFTAFIREGFLGYLELIEMLPILFLGFTLSAFEGSEDVGTPLKR